MGTFRNVILSTTALAALAVTGNGAFAGSFAVHEQSTWGQGASFAGVAAGGATSAMFWNPATMTETGKMSVENGAAFIIPHATQNGSNNLPTVLGFTDTGVTNSG